MQTYALGYRVDQLKLNPVRAPITVIKAAGDHLSWCESALDLQDNPLRLIQLSVDHYRILQPEGIAQLQAALYSPAFKRKERELA